MWATSKTSAVNLMCSELVLLPVLPCCNNIESRWLAQVDNIMWTLANPIWSLLVAILKAGDQLTSYEPRTLPNSVQGSVIGSINCIAQKMKVKPALAFTLSTLTDYSKYIIDWQVNMINGTNQRWIGLCKCNLWGTETLDIEGKLAFIWKNHHRFTTLWYW